MICKETVHKNIFKLQNVITVKLYNGSALSYADIGRFTVIGMGRMSVSIGEVNYHAG